MGKTVGFRHGCATVCGELTDSIATVLAAPEWEGIGAAMIRESGDLPGLVELTLRQQRCFLRAFAFPQLVGRGAKRRM